MKYDIFISYSRKDFKVVSKIAKKVSDAGYSVWMDVDGIESGDEFKSKIAFAIKNSKLFLFFSSQASNKSEWTVKEVNYAIKKKIPIIPIRLDNADYNDSVDFDLAGLDFIQCNGKKEVDVAVQKLMRSLEKKIRPVVGSGFDGVGVIKRDASKLESTGIGPFKHIWDFFKTPAWSRFKYFALFFIIACLGRGILINEDPVDAGYSSVSVEDPVDADYLSTLDKGAVSAALFSANGDSGIIYRVDGVTNGHEYVDLGLSVKWATCNVGATKPEEYGGYYAWGETEEKDDYDWDTYKWCNGSKNSMTKYCTDSGNGTVDNKTVLDPEDDVAHVKWGGSWRMPTKSEQQELLNNCTWTWTTQNCVNGYTVTGPNGNSIFLPAAGYRKGTNLYYCGGYCYYWSSSLHESYSYDAYYLYFSSGRYGWYYFYRFYGRSVRPVSK